MGGITHTNAMQSNVVFCVYVYVCVPVFARECAHVRMCACKCVYKKRDRYIFVHVHVRVCERVRVHAPANAHARVCVCLCVNVCVCEVVCAWAYTHICIYIYICVCTSTCTCMCMCPCMYMCIYIYTYVYIVYIDDYRCMYACMDVWIYECMDVWAVYVCPQLIYDDFRAITFIYDPIGTQRWDPSVGHASTSPLQKIDEKKKWQPPKSEIHHFSQPFQASLATHVG